MNGQQEPLRRLNIVMITRKKRQIFEISSQQELMNEFMANMSLNHGCIRIHKKRPSNEQAPYNTESAAV